VYLGAWVLGRRTFEQLKAEYGAISEAKKGECFARRWLLQVVMSCLFFHLNQRYSGKQIYNDRRLFLGGGQGVMHGTNFGAGASSQAADKRSGRGKGTYTLHVHVVLVLHI
jgi:hypothetical protein